MEQSCESLEELSLNNLNKLTGIPLEMVRKLCDSMAEVSLNDDEILEISKSEVVKKIGMEGVKKLHLSGAGDLLDISKLRKLCNAGVIPKLESYYLEDLVYVMGKTDLSVEEIVKLSVTDAFRFNNDTLVGLLKDHLIESVTAENLKKFCGVGFVVISDANIRKIFEKQEMITGLDTNELSRLCNDKQFLDEATSEEILSAVLGGKYATIRPYGQNVNKYLSQFCILKGPECIPRKRLSYRDVV